MTAVVFVESPAKAKTISKFLGQQFQVLATYGHIRDLPSRNGSVDVEHGFNMVYEVPKDSARHVQAITKAAAQADELLLATDPDREGEAISWHVLEVLREKHLLGSKPIKRVVFHEITQRAILEAVANARPVDMNLVNAQQARRALDYLVGFTLSPLLWQKVRRGLSAGRVQSVALRLICEREKAVLEFQPQEYWTIAAQLRKEGAKAKPFPARLVTAASKKLGKFDLPDEATARFHQAAVQGQPIRVATVERKQTKRNPAPPFITSTLQQEASRKLGFSAKKTMMMAQQLYEGLEVPTADGGQEVAGLITYMRTDSVHLADEAVAALRQLVSERYGPNFLPKTPRRYKSSTKNAQEAHEAVRPTDPSRTPESLKGVLGRDQHRLYELVWKRTVASQMASALIDQVAATLAVGDGPLPSPYQLRAVGSTVAFTGFIEVYTEGRDEVSAQDREEDDEGGPLPPLSEGERLLNEAVSADQHFTEPPPRFTEASLVKELERYGIGRPSTYAPTMSTLQDRGYVRLEERKFLPEDVGMVVNTYLTQHFARYVDYHFTAHLEDDLDAISRGERAWTPLLQEFWQPFIEQVRDKEKSTKRADVTTEAIDESCPQCGQPLAIKLGRYGRFKACTGYPQCRFAENLPKEGSDKEAKPVAEPVYSDIPCGKCQKPMLIKEGRYGKYLACSGYPACRNIQPLEKPKETGVSCPDCKTGVFQEKKSRRGKVFYSCSNYPKCKKALWDPPIPRPCPQCQAPFLTRKQSRKSGAELVCVSEGCGFRQPDDTASTA